MHNSPEFMPLDMNSGLAISNAAQSPRVRYWQPISLRYLYTNADQQKVASAYIRQVSDVHTFPKPLVTQLVPLTQFYRAEEHHQNYLTLHPDQPYIVFNDMSKLEHLRQQFANLYK